MSSYTPVDLVGVLLKRNECLRSLSSQPHTKPELVESLEIPRSTLDDITRELEQANLAKYHDGKWKLTLLGHYTLDHYTRYKEGLKSLTEATPVIQELPEDTHVDRRFLIGAEVHVATAPVPDEVMQVFLDAVETATHVRGVTPLALAGYAEPFYHAATTGREAQVEVILPLKTFERLRELDPDLTDKVIANGDITLRHRDIPVTFSLWIADDDHAGLIVYADQGVQGILINNTDDALNWAVEQYDCIHKDSDQIFYRDSSRHNGGFS